MSNVAAKVVIISIQSMKVKLFSKRSNQSMICSSQHSQKEENITFEETKTTVCGSKNYQVLHLLPVVAVFTLCLDLSNICTGYNKYSATIVQPLAFLHARTNFDEP